MLLCIDYLLQQRICFFFLSFYFLVYHLVTASLSRIIELGNDFLFDF